MLALLWEETQLPGDPPPVDLVREVPDEEWTIIQVECMTAAGFPPVVEDSVEVVWDVPAAQVEAFDLANYTCQARYPRLMIYQQPYDEAQLHIIYDWMQTETIPCYERQGYAVTGMPSRQAFAAQYQATQTFWIATDGVAGLEGPSAGLDESCPRMPPQELLFASEAPVDRRRSPPTMIGCPAPPLRACRPAPRRPRPGCAGHWSSAWLVEGTRPGRAACPERVDRGAGRCLS